nr:rhomboid family intramembrane serine protease [Streptococcus loxodontisalivarius]
MGALYPPLIKASSDYLWSLVTSMFIHFSFDHLAENMVVLYLLGAGLEKLVGHWKFLLIYFATGLVGSLMALLFSPNNITGGASGAIFGVMGFLLVRYFRNPKKMTSILGDEIIGYLLGISFINVIITFFESGISIPGHLGGLFTGLILGYLRFNNGVEQSDETIEDEDVVHPLNSGNVNDSVRKWHSKTTRLTKRQRIKSSKKTRKTKNHEMKHGR